MRIAFLFTCYNRKNLTLECIKSITSQMAMHSEHTYKIFVCDDKSTDGTVEAIKEKCSNVEVVVTSGNYYWGKGMHVVMKRAHDEKFDFYFMLNDDVAFSNDMVDIMLNSYRKVGKLCGVVGTTLSVESKEPTYGGRISEFDQTIVLPSEEMKTCGVANWNCFLISNEVIERVGLIDRRYSHGYGDYDYSMAMIREGISIYVATGYIGFCERNSIKGTYRDTSLSRLERLKRMHSRKGVVFGSQLRYYIKNFGLSYGWRAFFNYAKALKDIIIGE